METLLETSYKTWSNLRLGSTIDGDITLFSRYKVETLLGIGGTSLVVSARDSVLGRIVAVKIWNPYIWTHCWRKHEEGNFYRNEADYFYREARMLASFNHPNLCQIYDFGINEDGIPWLVMELINGISLRDLLHQWISNTDQHNLRSVFLIAKQAVAAVDYLHRKGLYQLDIKPENIIVNGNFVKLIDIASSLEKPVDNYEITHARYGTPGYVAPEIVNSLENKDIGPASDVFSLGITFLEMSCLYNPLASEELRKSAYEALRIVEREIFLDYATAAFFPDWNEEIRKWGENYTNELLQVDIRAILKSAPIRLPDTLIELIVKMTSLYPGKRPRNASGVLSEVLSIDSKINDFNLGRNNMLQKTTILFLAADPTDASRLRIGQELREIQEKLQLARMRDKFRIEQRMSVRPVDISQAILDEKPQIVHFSGHGTNDGCICFENEIGESHFVQPDALAALFELVPEQVNCVVLNACFSEVQAKGIVDHIKYVIGMSKAIGDKAAISFAVGFYQALGAGKPIEEAYKFGCVQIRLQGIPEHLTPVLFSK